jgi:hypothetical protein
LYFKTSAKAGHPGLFATLPSLLVDFASGQIAKFLKRGLAAESLRLGRLRLPANLL